MSSPEERADELIARLHRAILGRDVGVHHELAFHGEMPRDGDVILTADAVAWIDDHLERGGFR